jgi:hypothetical protein
MSDFLGSPTAHRRPEPDQARTLEMLATLFLVAFAVVLLYVGREIFIPVAIAILVSLNRRLAYLGVVSWPTRAVTRFSSEELANAPMSFPR